MSDIGADIGKVFGVLDVGRWYDEQTPRGTLLWRLLDKHWPNVLAYWVSEHCPIRWLPEPKIKQPSFQERAEVFFAQLRQANEEAMRIFGRIGDK